MDRMTRLRTEHDYGNDIIVEDSLADISMQEERRADSYPLLTVRVSEEDYEKLTGVED